jgi:hypothetical protein
MGSFRKGTRYVASLGVESNGSKNLTQDQFFILKISTLVGTLNNSFYKQVLDSEMNSIFFSYLLIFISSFAFCFLSPSAS